jgi:hypothetical protein
VTLPLPINTLVYKVPRDHPKEFLVWLNHSVNLENWPIVYMISKKQKTMTTSTTHMK